MKRYILILICILTLGMAMYADYKVYYTAGDVKVKTGNRTRKAVKGLTVKGSDRLKTSKGDVVKILDEKTRLVYKLATPIEITVDALIETAHNRESRGLGSLNETLKIGADHNSPKRVHTQKGVSKRRLNTGDTIVADTLRRGPDEIPISIERLP